MATITDPAYELGEIAERLTQGSGQAGDAYLASQFAVKPWSTEFVKILGCILERVDLVESIVARDGVDEGVRDTVLAVLSEFRTGFNGTSIRNNWNTAGHGLTAMKNTSSSLKIMSQAVRPQVSYPKLTEEEIVEFLALIDAYLAEIRLNGDEPEFVIQAIVDGLERFSFQLKFVKWMGSGYILEAFRELMMVYGWAAQRVSTPHELNASAVLKGLGALLKRVKNTVDTAKSWTDSGSAVVETYKLVSSVTMPLLLLIQQRGG